MTMTRRSILVGVGAVGAVGLGGTAYLRRSGAQAYSVAIERLTAPLPDPAAVPDLIRYATLAASGHNTQPWKFAPRDGAIEILPDLSRRTPVVDPDDHHLFASLGCAAENLSIAARTRGLSGDVQFMSGPSPKVTVDLTPGTADPSALLAAIPLRQCTRSLYDGSQIAPDIADRLVSAARDLGVDAMVIAEAPQIDDILSLIVEGNRRQMDDRAFVAELKEWIRFSAAAAARSGDGLYAAASGNPVVPSWIGRPMFDLFFTKQVETEKYVSQIRSSSALVVLVAATDDPKGYLDAGRACQRLALQATTEGLKYAFVNQPVEVPEMRTELRELLGLGGRRPNLVMRIGRAEPMPRSLRRPVDQVIV